MKELNVYSSQLIRELILPKLTQEVNSGKNYAQLRQVYFSLVLSRWFKQRFNSPQSTVHSPQKGQGLTSLIDRSDLSGLTSKEPWSKTTYFKEYQKSFAQGEYNLKEQVTTPTGQVIRSYVSGGLNAERMNLSTVSVQQPPATVAGSPLSVWGRISSVLLFGLVVLTGYLGYDAITRKPKPLELVLVQPEEQNLIEWIKQEGFGHKWLRGILEELENRKMGVPGEKEGITYYTIELRFMDPIRIIEEKGPNHITHTISVIRRSSNWTQEFNLLRYLYYPNDPDKDYIGLGLGNQSLPTNVPPTKEILKALAKVFKVEPSSKGGSSPLTLKASSMLKIDDGKIDEAIRFFRSHTYFPWSINIFLSENPHSTSTDPLDNIADSDLRKKALEKIGEYFVRYGNQEVVIEDAAEKIAEEAEKIKRFDVEKITPEQIKPLLAVYPEVIGKRYYGPDFRSNTSAPPQFFALPTLQTSGIGDIIGYLGKEEKTKKDKERVLQSFARIFADDSYHIKEAEDRAEEMIKRAEERLTTKASSSLTSALSGIDWTELEQYMRFEGLEGIDLNLPRLSKAELEHFDLTQEQEALDNLLASQITRSGPVDDRLLRYLGAVFQKGEFSQRQLELVRFS